MEIHEFVDKQLEFNEGKCYLALNLYEFLLLSEDAFKSLIYKSYENVTLEELDERGYNFLLDSFYCAHDLAYDLYHNGEYSKNFDIIMGYMVPGNVNDFSFEPLIVDLLILSKDKIATIDFCFKSYKMVSTREIRQRRLYKKILRRHELTSSKTIHSYYCLPKEEDDFIEDDFKLTSCSLTKLTESLLHFFKDEKDGLESLKSFLKGTFTERGN